MMVLAGRYSGLSAIRRLCAEFTPTDSRVTLLGVVPDALVPPAPSHTYGMSHVCFPRRSTDERLAHPPQENQR